MILTTGDTPVPPAKGLRPSALPVRRPGTVFIGVAVPGWAGVEPYAFPSRRPLVRGRAVTAALLQLTRALQRP